MLLFPARHYVECLRKNASPAKQVPAQLGAERQEEIAQMPARLPALKRSCPVSVLPPQLAAPSHARGVARHKQFLWMNDCAEARLGRDPEETGSEKLLKRRGSKPDPKAGVSLDACERAAGLGETAVKAQPALLAKKDRTAHGCADFARGGGMDVLLPILQDVFKTIASKAVLSGLALLTGTALVGWLLSWWGRRSTRVKMGLGALGFASFAALMVGVYLETRPERAATPFAILVADLDGDTDRSQTRHILQSLRTQFGGAIARGDIEILSRGKPRYSCGQPEEWGGGDHDKGPNMAQRAECERAHLG